MPCSHVWCSLFKDWSFSVYQCVSYPSHISSNSSIRWAGLHLHCIWWCTEYSPVEGTDFVNKRGKEMQWTFLLTDPQSRSRQRCKVSYKFMFYVGLFAVHLDCANLYKVMKSHVSPCNCIFYFLHWEQNKQNLQNLCWVVFCASKVKKGNSMCIVIHFLHILMTSSLFGL